LQSLQRDKIKPTWFKSSEFKASKSEAGRKEIPLGSLSFSYIPTSALLVCSEEPFSTDPSLQFSAMSGHSHLKLTLKDKAFIHVVIFLLCGQRINHFLKGLALPFPLLSGKEILRKCHCVTTVYSLKRNGIYHLEKENYQEIILARIWLFNTYFRGNLTLWPNQIWKYRSDCDEKLMSL
jgi:hypothetical protein